MSLCINCNKKEAKISLEVQRWTRLNKKKVQLNCCSEECKNEVVIFSKYVNENATKFMIFMILGCLLLILLPILSHIFNYEIFVPISIMLACSFLGLVVIKYPFATPETIEAFGRRTAVKLAKILGLIIIIIIGIATSIIIYLIQ
jgi:uncharacterized membrane protein